MKALVTGAPGWMGTRLFRVLRTQGFEVRCLMLPAFDDAALRKDGAETVRGDVTLPETLAHSCDGVDVVFHCAGIIHPRRVREFYDVNTGGTRHLADEAVRAGVRRFVYVSSSSAGVGYSVPGQVTEQDPPHPFMDYGRSKLMAEEYLKGLNTAKRLETVVLRPHWLYGEGGPARQVKFLKMIKSGRPLLFGDGQNLRSLCEVNNCIRALVLAGSSPNAPGQTYYVGDERDYTSLEIYETAARALGTPLKPRRVPVPLFDSPAYRLMDRCMQGVRFYWSDLHLAWDWGKNIRSSIEKARRELDYRPSVSLEEGMRLAVAAHRAAGAGI